MSEPRFYSYNEYLTNKYDVKTYKCPINIPSTCPNRDGSKGRQGCSFCSAKGTGFEAHEDIIPVKDQIKVARLKMMKRYKAQKFIGYFQNYTNTYMPLETFLSYINEAIECDLVGIDIATRPDTLPDEYLRALKKIQEENHLDITFELGLQIANDDVLESVHRGHSVADYEKAALRIKSFGFNLCTHLILNLPGTTIEDVETTVNLMNEVGTDIVKLHSLYIAKDSIYEKEYLDGKIIVGDINDYIQRVIYFITRLNPDIAIARLVSRIPKDDSVFSNWETSWWKVYNMIIEQLTENDFRQGMYYSEGRYGK